MKQSNSKAVTIAVIFLLLVIAGVAIYLSNKPKEEEEAPVELHEVPVDTEDDTVSGNSTSEEEQPVELHEVDSTEDSGLIDSKDFKYDPFAEDSGWGDESIFANHIIVSGGGKKDESSQGSQIIIADGEDGEVNTADKNTREMSAAEAKAAMMEKVKSGDYAYRINKNDFSDGFGIYMNPKYDLKIGRIMDDVGYIKGPNDTEVGIAELDPSISLEEHRKKLLIESGYRAVYNYSDGAMLAYDTPITLGKGIDDFENTPYYIAWRYNDESMNDYGGQLFCDTAMKSSFGEGYYIELYNATSNMYYGYFLVEHNGRIFKATGMSMYRDTILDITLATIDTCVYPY